MISQNASIDPHCTHVSVIPPLLVLSPGLDKVNIMRASAYLLRLSLLGNLLKHFDKEFFVAEARRFGLIS